MPEIDGGNWLKTLASGGIPQILAGPAGAAISRLIGVGVEIPAAWLEGFVENIKDRTKARSIISHAIAEKAAELAVVDPAIMKRAMESMLGHAYRAQTNREAIAKVAVESLAADPAPENTRGPSDDWLNKFVRLAEETSSEELQLTFGMILAGELRRSGSVTLSTLHFVSMLDQETATLIKRVLAHTSIDGFTFIDCIQPKLTFNEHSQIQQSGFWTPDDDYDLVFSNNNAEIHIVREGQGFELTPHGQADIALKVAIASRNGVDLLRISGQEFDFAGLASIALNDVGDCLKYGSTNVTGSGLTMATPTVILK